MRELLSVVQFSDRKLQANCATVLALLTHLGMRGIGSLKSTWYTVKMAPKDMKDKKAKKEKKLKKLQKLKEKKPENKKPVAANTDICK